ncbi:aldehyde reductase [Mangrovibacter sp. MFB070]|uniref:iron-containing alcohol dehydrogenase n=1 Tax=Mangrovibacter sp. MFB070 TaxID=1224318 RepID=UPI0004D39361|nr:iron-containing alcohol dehydrogenase [Mangrovibacter sp. MFB070]KEA49989.1 aldehyde reductase [Mangrovibacter sp. MFB070]
MQDFEFYNPTRIIFGQNRIPDMNTMIPHDARVLVLHGGKSAEYNGTLKEVRLALGKRYFLEFGGIGPNPLWETLERTVDLVRKERVNFLLAVGGGSVIDGTKFVAAAANFAGHTWDILENNGRSIISPVPFGVVLTLPATGSEMNCVSVITRQSTKTKKWFTAPALFPRFSILDPTKTYSLPARQLANGIVDSFVHITGQYLTYPVDARVQDRFAEGILQTLIEIGPKVVHEPAEYNSRANMMWAASMAHNGLIGAGVPKDWSTHCIGHELTALYQIDHARTLAIILPATLEMYRAGKRDKLLQYAERVWGVKEGDCDSRIDTAIANTREFFECLGMKTHLSDYALGKEAVAAVTERLRIHGMTQLGEHLNITPDDSHKILECSL